MTTVKELAAVVAGLQVTVEELRVEVEKLKPARMIAEDLFTEIAAVIPERGHDANTMRSTGCVGLGHCTHTPCLCQQAYGIVGSTS